MLIIANWKSQKTNADVAQWLKQLHQELPHTVIVCPSFVHLSQAKQLIAAEQMNLQLGAQDISAYGQGAYTGEVNGTQLREYVSYVIIGHSERRTLLHESDTIVAQKVVQAKKYQLEPIFCIQDAHTPIPEGVSIVAYEPPNAIGTGTPDTPENAAAVANAVKTTAPHAQVLYGGSVNAENVASFTAKESLDGVLVGGASLDPVQFLKLIHNA